MFSVKSIPVGYLQITAIAVNVRDGNCPVGIVRDGNCPGWELSGMGTVHLVGIVRGGNCPGRVLSGMGTVHLVGIVRGGNCPGWELSGYHKNIWKH